MKSICQNVIRKLEKVQGKDVPIKIVLGALVKCIQVFPSSFKQIVGSNRGGDKKKDSVTTIFEEMAKRYIDVNPQITSLCLKFLCLMFMARDKSKVHYKEFLSRTLLNFTMYMDCLQPRLFSDNVSELNKCLPIDDVCFSFIFDPAGERESTQKFTVKDMRN